MSKLMQLLKELIAMMEAEGGVVVLAQKEKRKDHPGTTSTPDPNNDQAAVAEALMMALQDMKAIMKEYKALLHRSTNATKSLFNDDSDLSDTDDDEEDAVGDEFLKKKFDWKKTILQLLLLPSLGDHDDKNNKNNNNNNNKMVEGCCKKLLEYGHKKDGLDCLCTFHYLIKNTVVSWSEKNTINYSNEAAASVTTAAMATGTATGTAAALSSSSALKLLDRASALLDHYENNIAATTCTATAFNHMEAVQKLQDNLLLSNKKHDAIIIIISDQDKVKIHQAILRLRVDDDTRGHWFHENDDDSLNKNATELAQHPTATELLLSISDKTVMLDAMKIVCDAWRRNQKKVMEMTMMKKKQNDDDCYDDEDDDDASAWSDLLSQTLGQAAKIGCLPVIQLLVEEYQCDVNELRRCDYTPLIQAVKGNHLECCRYLLEKGADPFDCYSRDVIEAPYLYNLDEDCIDGGCPGTAALLGHTDILKVLLEWRLPAVCVSYTIQRRDMETLELLLQHNCEMPNSFSGLFPILTSMNWNGCVQSIVF